MQNVKAMFDEFVEVQKTILTVDEASSDRNETYLRRRESKGSLLVILGKQENVSNVNKNS